MPTKRRNSFSVRSWYIGSGNKFSAFTRKPNIPYEKIKGMYGDALERFSSSTNNAIHLNKLSNSERLLLKGKIKKMIAQERRKTIISLAVTIVVTMLIFVLGFYLIKFLIRYYS
jgi:hypothetical protein